MPGSLAIWRPGCITSLKNINATKHCCIECRAFVNEWLENVSRCGTLIYHFAMRPLFILLIYVSTCSAYADVTLPKLVSDGMVLQRDAKVNIWGWADKGEKISVKFRGKSYRTTATASGEWKIVLAPSKAGGPFTLEITGNNSIVVRDILVGDVWFCSGQSNMVLTMERVKEKYPEDVSSANFPQIRNFLVPTYSDLSEVHKDLPDGKWVTTSPESVMRFGAVAFFFARKIHQKYGVPVGIINASVGGTPAQAWVSEEGLKDLPEFADFVKNYKEAVSKRPPTETTATVSVADANAPDPDLGLSGSVTWYDTSYVARDWKNFWLPGYWEDQGIKDLNGVVWFRREFTVPSSMAGKPVKLFMGRIVDADEAYVNGVSVGNITYQYPPRRYNVPAGVLKAGKNLIVIRVTNYNGKGGFVPDRRYYLTTGSEEIDLRGDWKYKVGQVFPPRTTPASQPFSAQNSPTGLFNTMVAPIVGYTIKGINWYQGESNVWEPDDYSAILTALIKDWRSRWNQGEIPFSFVQLANFMETEYSPNESSWAALRNQQRKTLAVPGTAMVVTIDLGEWNDIHPLNKKDVGERLALAAQKIAYGETTVVHAGPLYQSHVIKGNKVEITFTNTGSGLMIRGDEVRDFEVAGKDRKFVWAKARIEGDKVIIWSGKVGSPMYVRYAWSNNPERANLYNKQGLPASPFEEALN